MPALSRKQIAIPGGLMIFPLIANSFSSAIDQGIFGFANVDIDGVVLAKHGSLSECLPEPGRNCFDGILLFGMKSEFADLADGKRPHIVLPGVHGASSPSAGPITVVIMWDQLNRYFTIITTIDFSSRQIENLLGSERRARRLTEEQLEAANEELRRTAATKERLRLARDMHDTLAQSVLGLLIQIRLIKNFVLNRPERVQIELAKAENAASAALDHARRTIKRIRSPEKDEQEAIEPISLLIQRFADRTGIPTRIEISEDFEKTAYGSSEFLNRIVGEVLQNIDTHASARSVEFSASIDSTPPVPCINVMIQDDGIGFDPSQPKPNRFGLLGMQEFAALAGGACHVKSSIGRGTRIDISIPATDTLATGQRHAIS